MFASMTVDADAVALSSVAMAQQLRGRTHVLEIKRPLKQVEPPQDASHFPDRVLSLIGMDAVLQLLLRCKYCAVWLRFFQAWCCRGKAQQ